jgi:hypothetical protein
MRAEFEANWPRWRDARAATCGGDWHHIDRALGARLLSVLERVERKRAGQRSRGSDTCMTPSAHGIVTGG